MKKVYTKKLFRCKYDSGIINTWKEVKFEVEVKIKNKDGKYSIEVELQFKFTVKV